MSRMIPQETVSALRIFSNLAVDVYGIDCELYVPKNYDVHEIKDVFQEEERFDYEVYQTKVYIEWSPNQHRLRKLGIFMEEETPILAWFKNEMPVQIRSYIKIPLKYVPERIKTDEFEVVDIQMPHIHDIEVHKACRVVPRRRKE